MLYGGSVVAGGVVGGIGGAFFGGVGAIPGAAAGATAGGYLGGWVLTLLGLESFIDGVNLVVPEAFQHYEKGFSEAWGPTRYDPMHGGGGNLSTAAMHLANGHVVLIAAILTVIVTYLTRGKGDKAAFLQHIAGAKRLGPKPARWIEQNQDRLANHPALQSRGSGAGSGKPSVSQQGSSPRKVPQQGSGPARPQQQGAAPPQPPQQPPVPPQDRSRDTGRRAHQNL